jgi:hypothetical protein
MVNVMAGIAWFVLGTLSIILSFTGNGIIDTTIKFIPFVIWITGMTYNAIFKNVEKETEGNDKEQA